MAKLPVIIEISNHSARFLAFKSGLSGKSFSEPLTLNELNDSNKTEKVISFLMEHYPQNTGVYISAPPGSEFSREIILPFLEKKKVKEVIPFELESQLPYEVDEYVFDVIQWHDIENRQTHVNAIGALKKKLIPWLSAFREKEIPVRGIFSEQDALLHLFTACGEKEGILLFAGMEKINLMVVSAGRPLIFRSLPFGFDDLLGKLQISWKIEMDEIAAILGNITELAAETIDADFLKKNYNLSKAKVDLLKNEIQNFQQKIHKELLLTFNSISTQEKEFNGKYYLLTEYRNSAFVSLLDTAITDNTFHELNIEESIFQNLKREYLLAAGAGLSQSSSRGIKLLRDNLKKMTTDTKRKIAPSVIVMASLALLFFVLAVFLDMRTRKHDFEKARASEEKLFQQFFGRKPDAGRRPATLAKEIVQKEKKKTEIFRKFFATPRLSAMLVNANNALAAEAGFEAESINWDSRNLEIAASTDSFSDLARIKDNLKNTGVFEEVNSRREKAMPGSGGKNRIKFSLELKPKIEEF